MEFWIVDTFGHEPFSGSPAAVFFVGDLEDSELMQNIAMEINTPETVFVKDVGNGSFSIRSYTPIVEGIFLGNGIFAAAKIIKEKGMLVNESIKFLSRNKTIYSNVKKSTEISISMRTSEIKKISLPPELSAALSGEIIVSVAESDNAIIAEIRSPSKVSSLSPNIDILSQLPYDMIIFTADGHYERDIIYDVCTRSFSPKIGVVENCITPIAHVHLASYWRDRLGKVEFTCFQNSRRAGYSKIQIDNDFTIVSGEVFNSISGTMITQLDA